MKTCAKKRRLSSHKVGNNQPDRHLWQKALSDPAPQFRVHFWMRYLEFCKITNSYGSYCTYERFRPILCLWGWGKLWQSRDGWYYLQWRYRIKTIPVWKTAYATTGSVWARQDYDLGHRYASPIFWDENLKCFRCCTLGLIRQYGPVFPVVVWYSVTSMPCQA